MQIEFIDNAHNHTALVQKMLAEALARGVQQLSGSRFREVDRQIYRGKHAAHIDLAGPG